jgi:hypothetical protein
LSLLKFLTNVAFLRVGGFSARGYSILLDGHHGCTGCCFLVFFGFPSFLQWRPSGDLLFTSGSLYHLGGPRMDTSTCPVPECVQTFESQHQHGSLWHHLKYMSTLGQDGHEGMEAAHREALPAMEPAGRKSQPVHALRLFLCLACVSFCAKLKGLAVPYPWLQWSPIRRMTFHRACLSFSTHELEGSL